MNAAQPATSPKRYDIVRTSTLTNKNLEIRHNGQVIVWAELKTKIFKSPILNLHTGSQQGTIVAGAKFPTFSSGIDVVMGDPISAAPERYSHVERTSMFKGSWGFQSMSTGHSYEWRRTHRKELGASSFSNSDFKLVDVAASEQVLATYIKDSSFGGRGIAHMDFPVELGQDLELQAITSILAIEEKLRRQRANSAGAASAGAA